MRHVNFTSAPLSEDDKAELATWLEIAPDLPLLSAEQEAKATTDELVSHNLRLAVKLACKYAGRGVPVSDLCQEASLGLMRAARTFDAGRGRFSTYAIKAVVEHIARAVHTHGNTIRRPVHIMEQRRGTSSLATLQRARMAGHVQSLDEQVTLRNGDRTSAATLLDLIIDEGANTEADALKSVEGADLRQLIVEMFDQLNANERMVIHLRCVEEKTLEEIAALMGRTRQRVHQIDRVARQKLAYYYITGRAPAGIKFCACPNCYAGRFDRCSKTAKPIRKAA